MTLLMKLTIFKELFWLLLFLLLPRELPDHDCQSFSVGVSMLLWSTYACCKYLLSACYVPGTQQRAERILISRELMFWREETMNKDETCKTLCRFRMITLCHKVCHWLYNFICILIHLRELLHLFSFLLWHICRFMGKLWR